MAEAESPLVGRRLGEFVVREELSAGGFGTVFRAEQPALAREAVIKVLHMRLRASERLIQRFLREARLASRLDHPYAAHIYAFGAEPDGTLWIAMELVRGTPLDKLLKAQGPVSLERFVPLLERICQVVQTAHEQGIVHRDIKPGNVMVLARAGQLLPKLLDLGIAKIDADDPSITQSGDTLRPITNADLEATPPPGAPEDTDALAATAASLTPPSSMPGESSGRLTEDGAAMGSPLYMAPEQWVDASAVDARTDIYALGILSYEMLTGETPFGGINRFAIARAHAQKPPPTLPETFPPALNAVLAKAMAKVPAQRYASAIELATAFKQASGLADEPVTFARLPDAIKATVLASAPQPLAQAVASLEAARNPHHARDAVWQVARVATRLVGVTALSAHAHVGGADVISETSITDSLRRLRRRALPDAEWIALARELAAPFKPLRDVYPVPELVDFFASGSDALAELIALRDASDGGASDEQVRDLLAQLMPLAERLLQSLAFFADYRLVVTGEGDADVWMGVRRSDPPRLALRGRRLPGGEPALATADGVPVVSLYPFVQRHAPGPGVAPQLFFFEGKGRRGARLVALPDAFEVEDEALWEVVGGMVREPTSSDGTISGEETSPFPGLAAFTADDASRFFGRERETEGFVNRLRAQPLLAVVGPSGAGKSSFVQAGVVPNLPEGWQVLTLRPGAAPLVALTARIASLGFDVTRFRAELEEHPGALATMLRTRASKSVVVLVIDQLEELFTLCEDVKERALFAEAIVRAARSPDDPIRVVFTLRDDFLITAEGLPALHARLAPALHLLTTPGREDLLRILTEPLRRAGYELDDPALAGDMVDALAGTRSALALLSFTASKLWDLRDRRFRQLSRKAYASLGGVGGALAQHAEAALAAMLPEEQRLAREVFRHAVTSEGTRAVLSRAELDQILGGGVYAKAVIEKLVSARLLVVAEAAGGGEQIEITHEALIDAWPRLVTWRREDAEGARLRDQLRAAARQWDERGQATGLLWRGDALAEYRIWRGRYPGSLTDLENAFANASLAEAAGSARRRRLLIATAFTVLAFGAIALLFLNHSANEQRAVAQEQETRAEKNASELRDERRVQAEEQGRTALVDVHDAPLALRYLHQAADLGATGPAHDLLVAFAGRIPASKLRTLELPATAYRASFSPDGTRVVAACDDGTAHVWDAASGKELLVVRQQDQVERAEFASDGNAILTAGFDGNAVLWDAASGKELRRFAAGPAGDPVLCARLSPDRKRVITANIKNGASLWDAESGKLVAELVKTTSAGELQFGTPCAFSRDSRRVAVGDVHGPVHVWDAASGQLVATATGHTGVVNAVEFSPDGTLLATAASDNTAALWDAATGARRHELHHHDRVWAATFSSDGKRVATASNDRTAAVWSVETGAKQLALAGHVAGVNMIAFRPDGKQLATAADDGVAYLWDADTGRRESSLQGHQTSINDVKYSPRGDQLVTAGDHAILWSAEAQQPVVRLPGTTGPIVAIDFSRDGTWLATGDRTGVIRVWNRATLAPAFEIASTSVRDMRFSPDGSKLASGGRDGKVYVWDARTGKQLAAIAGHTDVIRQLAWGADSARIASASVDGTVRVSSLTGAPQIVIHHPPRATGVSFIGDDLLTTGADGNTFRWSLAQPETPKQAWHSEITLERVAFDHDGTHLLGSSTDQSNAFVWDATGTPASGRQLRGHHGSVLDAMWSPDGHFALTGSVDATARLWDPITGHQLAELAIDMTQVWGIGYSADGRWVATGTEKGDVYLWRLPVP